MTNARAVANCHERYERAATPAPFGGRVCCGAIPNWTGRVGQKWDTFDGAPYNLCNVIWRAQNRVLQNCGD
jgi:hypothetical protein